MGFNYHWEYHEANFGSPLAKQVAGGTHITFEIILKRGAKYIALRRPKGIPEHELPSHAKTAPQGLLYFCHNLIRFGESMEDCVRRIVQEQAGVAVKELKVVYIDSSVQEKDKQWAIVPHVIAQINKIPTTNNLVTEIVLFDKRNIPPDFAWWSKGELQEFLEEYD